MSNRVAVASTSPATAASAKDIAKDIAEDIAKRIARAEAASAAHAGLGIDARMAELIVGRSLLAVAENLVRLGGFLELLVRVGIIGIAVRVVLHRHPAVGLLDLLVVSTLADAEDLVVIAF